MAEKRADRMIQMDLLRIIACVMVVVIHVVSDGTDVTVPGTFQWYVLSGFMCISRPAVPIFFILSGMFMRGTDWKKGICKALHYLLIYFSAMALYQLLAFVHGDLESTPLLEALRQGMITSKYHLWFLEEYIPLLLVAPFINAAIEKVPGLAGYGAVLFVVSSVLRLTVKIHFGGNAMIWAIHSFLPDFDMEYVGYFLLGRVLLQKKNAFAIRTKVAAGILGMLATVCVFWLTHIASMRVGSMDGTYYSNFYLGVFLMALAWVILFLQLRIPENWHSLIKCVASKTLGIYLVHVFVIDELTRLGFHAQRITTIIGVPLKTVLVFGISLGLCMAWDALHRRILQRNKP